MSFGTFPPRVYREYASFLEEVTKDMDGAEKHYVLACKAAPEDASFLVSLAVFLGETRGRVKDAERVFEQVRKSQPHGDSSVYLRTCDANADMTCCRRCAWSRATAARYLSSQNARFTVVVFGHCEQVCTVFGHHGA